MKLIPKTSQARTKKRQKTINPKDMIITTLFFGLPMLVLAVAHVSVSVLSARVPNDVGNRYTWFIQNALSRAKKK
jgi:hypothetical protein